MMAQRKYWYINTVQGGCNVCKIDWTAKNAHGVAVRHHDATGHPVWVERILSLSYGVSFGEQPDDPENVYRIV